MNLSDLPGQTADALRSAGAYVSDLNTPTLRLGVTGLSRAGKTVFITALVRNLVSGGRLPFFSASAEGRILRAYLEPQPDDSVPRFSYEENLAALEADPPSWPESTRRISQLRLTIEYQTTQRLRRMIGAVSGGMLVTRRLHVDIVDYPGEWLTDLGMLSQSFAEWSAETLARMRASSSAQAREFLAFIADTSAGAQHEEERALAGAKLFTACLAAARAGGSGVVTTSPGRFLMPGDLAGSPLLTFFPLDAAPAGGRSSLVSQLARRFESYKASVVKPFFRDHFASIERQIVLVDVLGGLDGGAGVLRDMTTAMERVLTAFRPGTNSWLSTLFRTRVERILFAATKADHLGQVGHDRLEALLKEMSLSAISRAQFAGADVKVLAMAALRSTREAEMRRNGEQMSCVVGRPLDGEQIGGRTFDGRTEVAVFPGDIPADAQGLLRGTAVAAADPVRVLRFAPPRLSSKTGGADATTFPHIRLDRAVEFLFGDRLT